VVVDCSRTVEGGQRRVPIAFGQLDLCEELLTVCLLDESTLLDAPIEPRCA
jgi:hypothetical protein